MSPVSLIDLDPVPVTIVAGNARGDVAGAKAFDLIDVFDPEASKASPFVSSSPPGLSEPPGTPRTPRVGTSCSPGYTPGITRVPEGPPPATPPRVTSPDSILPAPPPTSPISPPPAPPSYGQSWDKGCSGQKGDKASEEPSRLVHQLPLLDIKESRYDASVTTGDWLARIAPVMRSLSPNAPSWWSLVTQTATGYYNRWLHADPLQKLSIKWEAIEAKMDFGPLARVEERASILILQALPVDLQSEAVSIRGLASSALIFLVMSRYQPGGSSEKSMILSYLTQPYVEGTLMS